MKALSTAASPLGVRIIEDEFALDLIVNEVHLCADHKHQGPFVDNDPHSSLLDDLVKCAYLILLHVVHHI